MKRIRLIGAAAALSLATLGLASTASASPAPAPPTPATGPAPAAPASLPLPSGSTSPVTDTAPTVAPDAADASLYRVCYYIGTPSTYCWTEHSDSPFYVFLNTSQSDSDLYYFLDTGECGGGYVTSTCPFTDTATDRAVQGHQIVMFDFYYSGLCMAARSDAYFDSAPCSAGTNEAFIAEDSGHIFVSVGASNLENDVEEVCYGGYNAGVIWADATECNDSALEYWNFDNG